MKLVAWLATVILIALAVILAALTLGAYAALNSGAPLLLRSLGTVSTALAQQVGLDRVAPLDRALILTGVSAVVAALAAYIKPRA